MALQASNFPECFVDIYPFEGGPYSFTSDALLAVDTNKNIKQDTGTFDITLAPVNVGNNLTWAQIITPMSLVVIGMRRGGIANIVMIGVVTETTEEQRWVSGESVERVPIIRGVDMAYFFAMTDYYSLWYLAAAGKSSIGITGTGLLSGDPGHIGQTWFQQIMGGGVFKETYVPYKTASVNFLSAFGTRFDRYDVTVPYGDYFLGANGPWFKKFRQIFPFPFYEFFVTTDSTNSYKTTGGTAFSTQGMGSSVTGTPVVVARLNPVPALASSVKNGTPSFDSIDTAAWDSLALGDLQGAGFIDSQATFTEQEAHNFYTINPIWLTGQNGQSNNNLRQFLFNYAVVVDAASINRYGYRPMMGDTLWLSDIEGSFAKGGTADLQSLMATLLGRFSGYYEATVLMSTALTRTFLRPDIQIGNRFAYAPYKDGTTWYYYIEGVQHSYRFGGPSTTHLYLTRGLPKDVYQASGANGLLYNIHIGNAQRKGGVYVSGLPAGSAAPLTAIAPSEFATWMEQLDRLYITPQATSP